MSKWVGFDNSLSDLLQAGSDSEVLYFYGWRIESHWMWIETLPYAPWGVPEFHIQPGDRVSVHIFVADDRGTTWFQEPLGGGLTSRDDSVWFMLYNMTRRLSYWGTLPTIDPGGQYKFTGSQVEFVLERPSDSNLNPYPLANFCITTMRNCAFADAEYGGREEEPVTPDDGSQPFVGDETYINMNSTITHNRLATAVSAQDPSSFGGYDIFWVFSNSS